MADFLDDKAGGAELIDRLYDGVMTRHLKVEIGPDSEYSAISSPSKRPSRNASQSSQRSNSTSGIGDGLSPTATIGRLSIHDEKSVSKTSPTPTKPITTKERNFSGKPSNRKQKK